MEQCPYFYSLYHSKNIVLWITSFYFDDLDCRFLEKSIINVVSIWVATEYEAESNDCVCIKSAWMMMSDTAIGRSDSFLERTKHDCVCFISAKPRTTL